MKKTLLIGRCSVKGGEILSAFLPRCVVKKRVNIFYHALWCKSGSLLQIYDLVDEAKKMKA